MRQELEATLDDLVTANHVLANEQVVDSYGHISVRSPSDPQRFFLSRSISPELVTRDDILEFDLGGDCVDGSSRKPYLERFIHGAIFASRPDVQSIVHNHAASLIPFGVTAVPLRPLLHTAGFIGGRIPTWDIADRFGDTDMLVRSADMGADLAKTLGPSTVVLMRGHGATVTGRNIKEAAIAAIYLQISAAVQLQCMALGPVKYLSPGEVSKITDTFHSGAVVDRVWVNVVNRLRNRAAR